MKVDEDCEYTAGASLNPETEVKMFDRRGRRMFLWETPPLVTGASLAAMARGLSRWTWLP